MHDNYSIGFIGGGNMAASLIGGLLHNGFERHRIRVADVDAERLEHLAERYQIEVHSDNATVVTDADVLVLAVKPQVLEVVCSDIAAAVAARRPLVVSIAAGLRTETLRRWLGGATIVRCMPNTPALVLAAATVLYAPIGVTSAERDVAESIMRAVGLTAWVEDEALMDVVTAISGSGPAYFFLLMEVLEDAAVGMGMERDVARLLVQQTALGTARIAIEAQQTPAALRAQVTSPGGTTERAIAEFESGGLRALAVKATHAARARAIELSELLGASR